MVRKGDVVKIKTEWQDRPITHAIVALEDQDGDRVLVEHQIPSMALWPVEVIRLFMLEN